MKRRMSFVLCRFTPHNLLTDFRPSGASICRSTLPPRTPSSPLMVSSASSRACSLWYAQQVFISYAPFLRPPHLFSPLLALGTPPALPCPRISVASARGFLVSVLVSLGFLYEGQCCDCKRMAKTFLSSLLHGASLALALAKPSIRALLSTKAW